MKGRVGASSQVTPKCLVGLGWPLTSHKPFFWVGCQLVNWVTLDRAMGIICVAKG